MSEKQNPIDFENLQKSIVSAYPGLNLKKSQIPSGIEINLEEGQTPFIDAKLGNHEFEFSFNPTLSEKNIITMLDSYPQSIPVLRRSTAIVDLYKKLFLSNLNGDISQTAGSHSGFFYSGLSADFIDNPFQKINHRKLISASAKVKFLDPKKMAENDHYGNIVRHIGTEIAKNPEILGLYQIEYDLQTKLGGKESINRTKYILLLVRGKFTKPKKEGDIREFHDSIDTKIVSRKIENSNTTDNNDKLLSIITAYIAEIKALQNPFRG